MNAQAESLRGYWYLPEIQVSHNAETETENGNENYFSTKFRHAMITFLIASTSSATFAQVAEYIGSLILDY